MTIITVPRRILKEANHRFREAVRRIHRHYWRYINWPRTNPIVLQREECTQLFFIYRGTGYEVRPSPVQFFRRAKLLSRNAVLFTDPYWAFYQKGISRSVHDVDALIGLHRKILGEMPHVSEIYCMGTSMGAYAAILFGYYLNVDAVWAFAPPTKLVTSRIGPILSRRIPDGHWDLSDLLSESNGITTYSVYYCDGCENDRAAAENIAHCNGVTVFPVKGHDHNVFRVLVEEGLLDSILPPARSA